MRRILVLTYSQSGDTALATNTFLEPLLQSSDVEIVRASIIPVKNHPFPWGNLAKFFDVLPECILELPSENHSLAADTDADFNLIVLAYPVWFLSPALPMQALFRSRDARLLKDRNVLTISVSRNMWHNAAKTMKRLLHQAGSRHRDLIAITHQGPPWATFITTPRALLFGKRDPFLKIFPPAGLATDELRRLTRLGHIFRDRLYLLDDADGGPLLYGTGAVRIQRRYVIPELIGWYIFRAFGHVILALGQLGPSARKLGVYLFVTCLALLILLALPLALVITALLRPLYQKWLDAYVSMLSEPSGEAVSE